MQAPTLCWVLELCSIITGSVQWEVRYIKEYNLTIEYLELFAMVAALLTWGDELKHRRISLFCDNKPVVGMLNKLSSSCHNCLQLLRILTLNNLINDRRVFAVYVRSADNDLADSLSHLQFKHFWSLAPRTMDKNPSAISSLVRPTSRVWGYSPNVKECN